MRKGFPLNAVAILIATTFPLSQIQAPTAHAQPPLEPSPSNARVDRPIPSRPSAPPRLSRRVPEDKSACRRQFVYRGRVLECDSQLSFDAENLRPILSSVPEAVAQLDAYQAKRLSIRPLAYVGTLGIVVTAAAIFASRKAGGLEGIAIRNIGVGSGLLLTFGSLLYGVSTLRTNEERLGEAVQLYNRARPGDPIELKFTTELDFLR